jgi:hypothetical protein
MGTIVREATTSELQQLDEMTQAAAASAQSTVQSGNFVFVAAFDGTNDNKENPAYSNDVQSTNVGVISDLLERANAANSDVSVNYYAGPGTPGTLPASAWLSPFTTQEIINQAEKAYRDFNEGARSWLTANPEADPQTSIAIAFVNGSRGDASGAVFSQLVWERGVTDADGTILVAPGKVGFAGGVSFDGVTTGVSGNHAYAPNVTNVIAFRAENEQRYAFKFSDQSDQPGVLVFGGAGNHGDVLGFYDQGLVMDAIGSP